MSGRGFISDITGSVQVWSTQATLFSNHTKQSNIPETTSTLDFLQHDAIETVSFKLLADKDGLWKYKP